MTLTHANCPDCGYQMPAAEYDEHMRQHIALQRGGSVTPERLATAEDDSDPVRQHHRLMMETLDALRPHVDATGAAMIEAVLRNTEYGRRDRG